MALAPNIVQGPWQQDVGSFGQPQQAAPPQVESEALSLTKKKQMFQESEDALQDARILAFRDEDFYHNFNDNQWSKDEKATLEERGQPIYTHNRCKRKVKTLKGIEQRSRTDPKAFPRKPQGEGMAEVATDVLNAIDDKTKFDAKASRQFADMTITGIEAVEVIWDSEENEIKADKIRYDELFYDPRSKEEDFEDARYIGYAKWWDLEEAQAKYPDKANELVATVDSSNAQTEYEDRPVSLWTSRHAGRRRIRILVMYYKDPKGTWRLAHFAGNADLYDEPSPWVDDKDKPICGIAAQACYKDRENRAYGVLRDMIGPQQELNHYRAKMWHYANNRRTWGNDGAFDDVDGAKSEMAKVDGHVVTNPAMKRGEDWDFIESDGDVQIFSLMLEKAEQQIQVDSPNEALVGRQAASQSGRAGQIQRDAGMTEEHDVFDLHRQWKEAVYKRMFWMARQWWREPDLLRVTDEKIEGGFRFVPINEPVANEFGMPMGVRNDMSQIDVDIVVKTMPEVAVLQEEQFERLAGMVEQGFPIPPKVVIQASQLQDKEEILKGMEEMQAPPPDPMAQQAAALELADKKAGVEEKQAKTAKTGAEAQAQAMKNQLGLF